MSRLWRESVFFLFLSVFGFSGCDKDIQMVSLGIDDIYYLPRITSCLYRRGIPVDLEVGWTG